MWHRFWAEKGAYPAYGLFSISHIFLVAICVLAVAVALFATRSLSACRQMRLKRGLIWFLWFLEAGKILFHVFRHYWKEAINSLPLYYCSLTLYCGLLTVYGKGKWRRLGELFMVIGGFTGGVGYLLVPCSTAGSYPAFHFITACSFLFHAIMLFLSLFLWQTYFRAPAKKEILPYAAVVVCVSILAYGLNRFLGTNLMFISHNYPGTPIAVLYGVSPRLFPVMMTVLQATVPFCLLYPFLKNR